MILLLFLYNTSVHFVHKASCDIHCTRNDMFWHADLDEITGDSLIYCYLAVHRFSRSLYVNVMTVCKVISGIAQEYNFDCSC